MHIITTSSAFIPTFVVSGKTRTKLFPKNVVQVGFTTDQIGEMEKSIQLRPTQNYITSVAVLKYF